MKSILGAGLLAGLVSCVNADTLPSKQLVMEYVTVAGIRDNIDRMASAMSRDLVDKGLPDKGKDADRLLASTMGWPAVQEEFIALIQRTYTTEELEAMIAFARLPAARGLSAKSEQFMAAANALMHRQGQLLEALLPTEFTQPSITVGDAHLPVRPGVTYAVPPKPVYPGESRYRGEAGVVKLMVLVGPSGEAEAVGVRESSGFPRLDEAALAALAQAKFHPHVENGVPVRAYVPATLTFQLSDEDMPKAKAPFGRDALALPGR